MSNWRRQFPRSFVHRDFGEPPRGHGPLTLTIKDVKPHEFTKPLRDGEEPDEDEIPKVKLVVTFEETKFFWIAGIEACESIEEATGEEDDSEWVGHVIELYEGETTFGNKPVDCIRAREAVEEPKPKPKKKRAAKKSKKGKKSETPPE